MTAAPARRACLPLRRSLSGTAPGAMWACAVLRGLAVLGLAASLAGGLVGCEEVCGGHRSGYLYCKGSDIVSCQDNWEPVYRQCAPSECREVPGEGVMCILPGMQCPTPNLGYQCMGEHRISCLAGGLVEDVGACPVPVTEGSPISHDWWGYCKEDVDEVRAECRPTKAPYCVENPGGQPLACGWKKERCSVEGEVRCFEDGSAICTGQVYTGFVANTATGQTVCDVTKVEGCWDGKTWCEGDVVKRCDQCLGENRCLKITTQAVCDPGMCTDYQYPWWVAEARQTVHDDAAGCAVAVPECDGRTETVCVGDKPAACVGPGKGVIALTCGDFQTFVGSGYFGPFCVDLPGTTPSICALDPTPCLSGHFRCDPQDPNGKKLQRCMDSVWFVSESCAQGCQTTATTSACE